MTHPDKRRYVRHYFLLTDALQFQIKLGKDPAQSWPCTLLCLGGGGLGFIVPRHLAAALASGSRIHIHAGSLPAELRIIDKLECEIVYVLDNDTSIFLSFGCQFTRISKNARERIIAYVAERNRAVIAGS